MPTRNCKRCQKPFEYEVVEIMGITMTPPHCEACEAILTAEPDHPKKRQAKPLGDDWPAHHRAAIDTRTGPAHHRADTLWKSHVAAGATTLIVYGDRGLGKTWIATYWAFLRGQAGQDPGIYRTAYDLFLDLRQSWRSNSTQSEKEAMDTYKRVPFLVLDQMHQCRALGQTTDNAAMWERLALADLLDYRYRENKTTILILTATTPEEVAGCFDSDILSRVKETGGLVACNWKSYRDAK